MNAWFPLVHQVFIQMRPGPGYLPYIKSIWIGLTAMLLNLPYTLWVALTKNVGFWNMIVMVCKTAAMTIIAFPILGFAGMLGSNVVSPEEAQRAMEDEKRKQIEALFADDE